jgi:peptidyl-prolyl cis-trans isomerase A (cyclophilin A)
MKRPFSPAIEPLESRIAPAVTIVNPIFDIKGGVGATSAEIDLAKMVDPTASYRTVVEFVTNFTMPGQSSPAVIRLQLFDDKTPLTVQNFLSYVNNTSATGDYDGTYFHRFVNNFVLQGGGYNPPISNNNLGTHIDTPFQVHNEYIDGDAELDPVAGTVAMAKVGTTDGGGPHSATSEFFFNYTDNSATLDGQNGGFTVFGKVIQGMDVINQIVSLRKAVSANLTTSATDGIPTTAPAGSAPAANQLIQIVSASVVAPTAGNKGNHQFSNLVVERISGDDFLGAQLDPATSQLFLDYTPHKAGVAKVSVTVKDTKGTAETTDDESTVEEFTVTILPNLVASVDSNLGTTVIPGQKGTTNVTITNNAAGAANGDVKVKLFLSKAIDLSTEIKSGFTLEETETAPGANDADVAFAELTKSIDLDSGENVKLPIKYIITPEIAAKLEHGSFYRILAKIETPGGSTVQELFTDDNVGNFRGVSTFKNAFGTVDSKAGVSITLADGTDATPSNVTLILKGPGSGEAVRDANGKLNITLSGTTSATSFTIKTLKGVTDAEIGKIDVTNAIGSLKLPTVTVTSHIALSGGVKAVSVGKLTSASGTSNFDIGGLNNVKTSLVFGDVSDYEFRSEIPIKSLSAKQWLNSEMSERETLTFSGLSKLAIKGNFQANIDDRGSTQIGSIAVGGELSGGTIATHAAVKKLTTGNVTGATFTLGNASFVSSLASSKGTLAFKTVSDSSIDASYPVTALTAYAWKNTALSNVETLAFQGLGTLKITGNTKAGVAGDFEANITERSGLSVKSIVAKTIKNSVIKTAGELDSLTAETLDGSSIFAGVTAKPTDAAGLANARNIGSVAVKAAFLNSSIAGAQIGKIAVAGVDGATGAGKFGFYADVIKSYVRAGGPKLTNVTGPAAGDAPVDTAGVNYEVRVF